MSAGEVAILNTKLDILIDDFKSFKKYALSFVVVFIIPFTVYCTMTMAINHTDIAVMQEVMKAIR